MDYSSREDYACDGLTLDVWHALLLLAHYYFYSYLIISYIM
jgi:hypothetical protein